MLWLGRLPVTIPSIFQHWNLGWVGLHAKMVPEWIGGKSKCDGFLTYSFLTCACLAPLRELEQLCVGTEPLESALEVGPSCSSLGVECGLGTKIKLKLQ